MSHSSTPANLSKVFTKRRRAYVACVACRKRKIKCVTASDADYDPCTRCKQKGIQCEFTAVPDDDDSSSHPGTPSPDAQGPSRNSGWGQTSQPGIRPPSAGIAGYLGAGSAPPRGANRSPRPGANAPYPQPGAPSYPYRPNAMRSVEAQGPPPHPQSSVPYVSGHGRTSSSHRQGYGQPGPQFYNAGPSQRPTTYPGGPNAGHPGGPYYDLNADYPYANPYVPQVQAGNTAYQWPQTMPPTAFAPLVRVTVAQISTGLIPVDQSSSDYILTPPAPSQLYEIRKYLFPPNY
ncbi:hypothetical protein FB451DRAFT_1433020 [Mycena latifolia]|nr:hypothetical protein FB451DRAFT_1433020 [Mycena latifolia]